MIAMKTKSIIPEIWDQITSVLKGDATPSENIAKLLEQTKDGAESVKTARDEAKSKALRTSTPKPVAAAAWGEFQNLEFEFLRMTNAIADLEEQYKLALVNEDSKKKISRYKEVEEERDKVASRIKAEYPHIQKSLLSLINDIMQVSLDIEEVNISLPDGFQRLDKPEGKAFGVPDGGAQGVHSDQHGEMNRISRMIVPDHNDPLTAAWPPEFNRFTEKRPRFIQLLSRTRRHAPDRQRVEYSWPTGTPTLINK